MSELSPENRALFERGTLGLAPRQENRDRIERALALQLGLAAGADATASIALAAGSAAAGVAKSATGSGLSFLGAWGKWTAALAIVGGLGAVGVHEYRSSHTPPPITAAAPIPTMAEAPPLAEPSPPAEPAAALEPAPETSASAAHRPLAPTPSQAPKGSVAEEAKLLRDADAALRRGDPAGALSLLEEHRRTFPKGVLAPERNVVRVLALCRLGRSDGKKEAQRLVKANPKSALAASMRAACGLEPDDH